MEPIIIGIVTSLTSAGIAGAVAAWGSSRATKATLNGTVARTERIEQKLDTYITLSQVRNVEVSERLTRIETKIED